MGNLDQAITHFEDALGFRRKGYRPEPAWTCCHDADTLLQRASTRLFDTDPNEMGLMTEPLLGMTAEDR